MNTIPVTPLTMTFYLLYLGLAIATVALWFLPAITPASVNGLLLSPAPDLSRFMVTDKLWRRGLVTSAFLLVCILVPVLLQFGIWQKVNEGELVVIREAEAANGWTQTAVIPVDEWQDMKMIWLDSMADQVQTETGEFKFPDRVAYGNLRRGSLINHQSVGPRIGAVEDWIHILPEHEHSGWNATFSSIDWRLVFAPIYLFVGPFVFACFVGVIFVIIAIFAFFACAGDLASMGILGVVLGRLLWIFNRK